MRGAAHTLIGSAVWSALGLVAAAVSVSGCSSSSEPPSSEAPSAAGVIGCAGDTGVEEFATNLTHKGDHVSLSFVIEGSNFRLPAVNNNNIWTVKVLDASGAPVKDATLTFPARSNPSDPWMPKHGHGAPPGSAVNNNDGTYAVSVYFTMGGIWSTYISAASGSVTDSTTFTFCVGS